MFLDTPRCRQNYRRFLAVNVNRAAGDINILGYHRTKRRIPSTSINRAVWRIGNDRSGISVSATGVILWMHKMYNQALYIF